MKNKKIVIIFVIIFILNVNLQHKKYCYLPYSTHFYSKEKDEHNRSSSPKTMLFSFSLCCLLMIIRYCFHLVFR